MLHLNTLRFAAAQPANRASVTFAASADRVQFGERRDPIIPTRKQLKEIEREVQPLDEAIAHAESTGSDAAAAAKNFFADRDLGNEDIRYTNPDATVNEG